MVITAINFDQPVQLVAWRVLVVLPHHCVVVGVVLAHKREVCHYLGNTDTLPKLLIRPGWSGICAKSGVCGEDVAFGTFKAATGSVTGHSVLNTVSAEERVHVVPLVLLACAGSGQLLWLPVQTVTGWVVRTLGAAADTDPGSVVFVDVPVRAG
jgi:hypothetical protein